jgi:predicted flap endonuclease-1-like 5' DNA nuclease
MYCAKFRIAVRTKEQSSSGVLVVAQIWSFLLAALVLGAALGAAVLYVGTRKPWSRLQADRDAFRMRFEQSQGETFRLRNSLTEREARCNTLESELANERSAHEAERTSLREQLDAAATAHAGAVAARDAANRQLDNVNRQLDTVNRQVSDMRARLSEREAELTAARAELTSIKRTHESDLGRARDAVTALTTTRDNALKRLEDLQGKLNQSQPELQAARSELAQANARVQALERELAQTRTAGKVATLVSADAQTTKAMSEMAAIAAAPVKGAEVPGEQVTAARAAETARKLPGARDGAPPSVAELTPEALAEAIDDAGDGRPPSGLRQPRGTGDDLKEIGGVGPTIEKWLHQNGIYHFWQIAQWGPAELAWVIHQMPSFGERVTRENWVLQASQLARGEMTDAKRKYLAGDQT